VDTVVFEGARVPSLGLARALGCETYYDPRLKGDRAKVSAQGNTTIPGVFLAGDVLAPGTEEDARRSGRIAGEAAADWVESKT
jgi:thioredoxin reductase